MDAWTLFTSPPQESLQAPLPSFQVTFSILIVIQTWPSQHRVVVDWFGAACRHY
jgi:hypothetical protein